MNKLILSLSFLLFVIFTNSQSPQFQWAKKTGGFQSDEGSAIAVDAAGNVYTMGYFYGTVDFDPSAATSNLTSHGLADIFISKLDPSGNFLWAKSMGSAKLDFAYSIDLDASANVYITGMFNDTVDFDPGISTFNLISAGTSDAFILKLNSSGNFVWAKRLGGASFDQGQAIKIDAFGNVYTTGWFQGTSDFDPSSSTSSLTSNGLADVFISKLDSFGNFVWAKNLGGASTEYAYGIAVDGLGNVYTTGNFTGTADFDPSPSVTFNLNAFSAIANDAFISKLDPSGNFVWAKQLGGAASVSAYSIATDATGNIYTTGQFKGTVDFDPGATGIFNLTSVGYTDVYISKLNTLGNFVWAKKIGDASYDEGRSVATDAWGSVYLTGKFFGTVDFDPDSPAVFNLTASDYDIFISKLDVNGKFIWAKAFGGTNAEEGMSVTVSKSGDVFATGYFSATVDFDPGAGVSNLTASGVDAFILRMSQSAFGIEQYQDLFGINIYPNPSCGIFNVVAANLRSDLQIEIYSSLGELVYSQKTITEINKIDLSMLADGLYFVKIFDKENKAAVIKIMKRE